MLPPPKTPRFIALSRKQRGQNQPISPRHVGPQKRVTILTEPTADSRLLTPAVIPHSAFPVPHFNRPHHAPLTRTHTIRTNPTHHSPLPIRQSNRQAKYESSPRARRSAGSPSAH